MTLGELYGKTERATAAMVHRLATRQEDIVA